MIRKIFCFLSLILLGACSTVLDGPTQDVRFETPGVEGGICFLEQSDKHSRRVWVPKTVKIMRTEYPLKVTCFAPGNREKTITVEPVVNRSTLLNIATAGTGGLVDYQTGAMFAYPDLIVVDFTEVSPQPMPLPAYQSLLNEHPELKGLEEFRPGIPAMLRDRSSPAPELKPRQMEASPFSDSGLTEVRTPENEGVFLKPVGGSDATAESLTRQMNPGVFREETSSPGGSFTGGTAVIGSPEDLATYPPVPLSPTAPFLPDAGSEAAAAPEEVK